METHFQYSAREKNHFQYISLGDSNKKSGWDPYLHMRFHIVKYMQEYTEK